MHTLAEMDLGRGISTALTIAIVPLILRWFFKSAQAETLARAGSRIVAYPKVMKGAVIVGWILTVALAIWGVMSLKNDGFPSDGVKNVAGVVGIFAGLMLVLHLETFGVQISWDDTHIYTRSGWRRSRKIPFSAVRSCDYSNSMQWYRIHTEGYGIIRLHQLTRGIPDLLAALPCPHPGHPPGTLPL